MGVTKKVIDKVKEAIKPKKVIVVKGEVSAVCTNCNDSGLQCSTCSVPFTDTFK